MDKKLTALTELTAPISTDIVYVVDDPASTKLSRKVSVGNLGKGLTNCPGIVETGALNAGSITSGFGGIDVGASAIDGGVITADTNFAGDITGDVTGNCTGSAGSATTVTNATLTTAITVDTGTVGLTGNVGNSSVLTLGAGASSVSGSNTGDQTNVTGTAATVTGAAQAAITSVGTLTGLTMGGNIILEENSAIALDPAGSADGKYTGITITGVAGENLAFGELVWLDVADSKWLKTDADADATSGAVMIAMVVVAGNEDAAITLLLYGQVRADAQFPALTISAPVYVATDTTDDPGEITVTAPAGSADVVRVVGHALTADEILFNPSPDWIVIA